MACMAGRCVCPECGGRIQIVAVFALFVMMGWRHMELEEIVAAGAVVFYDKKTDILIAWDGDSGFLIYAGRFDGAYDVIDSFCQDARSVAAARIAAGLWFRQHEIFHPGP